MADSWDNYRLMGQRYIFSHLNRRVPYGGMTTAFVFFQRGSLRYWRENRRYGETKDAYTARIDEEKPIGGKYLYRVKVRCK
jgi:hypothetical protein